MLHAGMHLCFFHRDQYKTSPHGSVSYIDRSWKSNRAFQYTAYNFVFMLIRVPCQKSTCTILLLYVWWYKKRWDSGRSIWI